MQFAFDLISDLHIENFDQFDWSGQATSPVCIVAGDVCRNRTTLLKILKHLGQCYRAVFYIDGNEEHIDYINNLDYSYQDLVAKIEQIPNVVYLQSNVIVVEGVALVATMGWWSFDFDLSVCASDSIEWYRNKFNLSIDTIEKIRQTALAESLYMINTVKRLQKHPDVKKIVMITHTVPDPSLTAHDIDLAGSPRINVMGNRYMLQALTADTEKKIHTWCFGHYHNSVDQLRNNIRFVNNCRGKSNTKHYQHAYYPRRIVVDV